MIIARSLHLAFECLLPQHCLVCSRPFKGKVKVCTRCFPSPVLGSASLGQMQLRFLWSYDGAARDFIHQMKYRPESHLCYLAGEELRSNLCKLYPEKVWDLVVPIPSSPQSLKKRQFNQCRILAEELIKAFPQRCYEPRALRYTGSGTPQASLPQERRLHNVKNAFEIMAQVNNLSVLLVDDVITTGATSAAAAAVLFKAGASRVDILSLALADSWHSYQDRVQRAFFADK